jgi:hypothetical protein
MTLGYLLFEDPGFGYFADDQVEDKIYWFLRDNQLNQLDSIKKQKPDYGSLIFPYTHYYIMREGWGKDDKMLIISAGLDSEKPDHQHGDMLGIQAVANGNVILPNYQVRYSLDDLELFKNSRVKNVALVDDELQGKKWTSNKGGSGFGKFKNLPNPSTIVWDSNDAYDLYVGSHDGFEDIGVSYSRQVIYVKNDFWIVKDNFSASEPHTYKQVWQGHYTSEEGPNLIRSNFENAAGCDISQVQDVDHMESSGARGKQWTTISKKNESDFQFITIIYPYKGYSNRLNEKVEKPSLQNWILDENSFISEGSHMRSLSKKNESFLFKVRKMKINGVQIDFSTEADVFVQIENTETSIRSIDDQELLFSLSGTSSNKLDGSEINRKGKLKPGGLLEIRLK